MMRNGEYYGISLVLHDKVYPLFNSHHIQCIIVCIEKQYENALILVQKYNLENEYSEHGNEIFKYIVNQFMILNDKKPIYQMKANINVPSLYFILKKDAHTLIPCEFHVSACGTLLPQDWIYRIFANGEDKYSQQLPQRSYCTIKCII